VTGLETKTFRVERVDIHEVGRCSGRIDHAHLVGVVPLWDVDPNPEPRSGRSQLQLIRESRAPGRSPRRRFAGRDERRSKLVPTIAPFQKTKLLP